jgi:hypothetical protein
MSPQASLAADYRDTERPVQGLQGYCLITMQAAQVCIIFQHVFCRILPEKAVVVLQQVTIPHWFSPGLFHP